jgi:hypothetical protein
MSVNDIRNPIAHPVMTKKQAEQFFRLDLCDELSYLRNPAITLVTSQPLLFKLK